MVKLIFFFIIMIIILVFPIYENSKVSIKSTQKINKNIAKISISDGEFYKYVTNLVQKGYFKELNMYKNKYISFKLLVRDLEKNESYSAKKAILINKLLKAYDFKLVNNEYNFFSNYVEYDLKSKDIHGEKFFLYSDEYNSTGKKFLIDNQRNISALDVIFKLKVNR